MKILYIPQAMKAALEAAKVGVKDLKSLERLANILSPEDVAFYCYIQMDLSKAIPAPIATSFPSFLVTVDGGNPFDKAAEERSPALKEAMRVLNEYCLNEKAPSLKTDGMKLTCTLMDEETMCFTHVPSAADEAADSAAGGEYGLYDRLIQQLSAFYKLEELAKLPLFAAFLNASQAVLAKGV